MSDRSWTCSERTRMKQAVYVQADGARVVVEYDDTAPCAWCGLPVVVASMGGPGCCPWCDLGVCRVNRGCRVDNELDPTTGKIMLPKKHYEKYHSEVFP